MTSLKSRMGRIVSFTRVCLAAWVKLDINAHNFGMRCATSRCPHTFGHVVCIHTLNDLQMLGRRGSAQVFRMTKVALNHQYFSSRIPSYCTYSCWYVTDYNNWGGEEREKETQVVSSEIKTAVKTSQRLQRVLGPRPCCSEAPCVWGCTGNAGQEPDCEKTGGPPFRPQSEQGLMGLQIIL